MPSSWSAWLFGRHPFESTRRNCLLRRMSQVLAGVGHRRPSIIRPLSRTAAWAGKGCNGRIPSIPRLTRNGSEGSIWPFAEPSANDRYFAHSRRPPPRNAWTAPRLGHKRTIVSCRTEENSRAAERTRRRLLYGNFFPSSSCDHGGNSRVDLTHSPLPTRR